MVRAGLLALALLSLSGACRAEGKTALPIKVPRFVRASNGLPFMAAFQAGQYLTRVALHFAGLDPPLDWVPPPKSEEIFPDWVDEPIARPAVSMSLGQTSCGEFDLGRLAAALQEQPPAPIAEGLIRLDGALPPSTLSSTTLEQESAGCLIPPG